MPVKIRLMRIGAKKRPFYRIVAVDERKKRTGKYLELLGTYNPLTEPKEIIMKQDRIDWWFKNGAVMSDGYMRITKQAPQKPPRKPKKEKGQKEQPAAEKPAEKQEKVEVPEEEVKQEENVQEVEQPVEEAPAEEKTVEVVETEQPAEATEEENK